MIDEIANLPDISFIDNVTLEDVQEKMLADYAEKYEELTGTACALKRADPSALVLYACSVYIFQGLLYVDRAGKQDLLKYSYGDFLDNLAALKGVTRNAAEAARVTMLFTLSEARTKVTPVPAGTRVTDGETYFATENYTEIAAGEESAEVSCICLTEGTDGNGIAVGAINILVDPIPYVASVSNIETSSGGTDTEDDDTLKQRVYLAPSSYSVAGPGEAYKYWCLEYNSDITDVYVDSPDPTVVVITFIMEDGELPNDALIEGLAEFLQNEEIRPLTDEAIVQAPALVEYEIEMEYYINASDASSAQSIQEAVEAAVEDYAAWQRTKIGRDITASKLIQLVMAAGAKRVEVTSPAFTVVGAGNIASCINKTITYGGLEDD